jgi:hypothetical protein
MRGEGWTKTLPYIVTRLGLGLAVWCPPRRSPASASHYVTRRKYGTVHVKLAKVTVPALHGRAGRGESRNGMRGIRCGGGWTKPSPTRDAESLRVFRPEKLDPQVASR